MEVNLNNEVIQESLNKMVDKATQAAFSDWQVSNVIEKVVADKVVGEILNKSMEDAVKLIDIDGIVTTLAKHLQKSMISAVCSLIEESIIDMIFRIRFKDSYYAKEEIEKAKAQIKAELQGRIPSKESAIAEAEKERHADQ